jgi:hypothetical protein
VWGRARTASCVPQQFFLETSQNKHMKSSNHVFDSKDAEFGICALNFIY